MAKIVKIRDKKLIWRENSSIFLIFIRMDAGEKIWAIHWHLCSGAALCYTYFYRKSLLCNGEGGYISK